MKKKEEGTRTNFEPRELTVEERAELIQLAKQPDSTIDYSDIPRTGPEDWRDAEGNSIVR
jgi:hypothetical protein